MEHDLLVITDEVYEHLVFDGAQHLPIATFPGMAQRTLSVSGAGKTFSVTGWKIGWVCGPAHLVAAARAAPAVRAVTAGRPRMITTDDHYRYYAERSQRVV
jgi:N-succinyldiaminopimelate aminotransferase